MVDDDMLEVLDDDADDATEVELREFIDGLNVDEQVELVALAWVGRGSFAKEEWEDAVAEARHAHKTRSTSRRTCSACRSWATISPTAWPSSATPATSEECCRARPGRPVAC